MRKDHWNPKQPISGQHLSKTLQKERMLRASEHAFPFLVNASIFWEPVPLVEPNSPTVPKPSGPHSSCRSPLSAPSLRLSAPRGRRGVGVGDAWGSAALDAPASPGAPPPGGSSGRKAKRTTPGLEGGVLRVNFVARIFGRSTSVCLNGAEKSPGCFSWVPVQVPNPSDPRTYDDFNLTRTNATPPLAFHGAPQLTTARWATPTGKNSSEAIVTYGRRDVRPSPATSVAGPTLGVWETREPKNERKHTGFPNGNVFGFFFWSERDLRFGTFRFPRESTASSDR